MESKKLRIIYMGTPDFAVGPLRTLSEGGYHIAGVVTVPDKPSGRGLHVHKSAVKEYTEQALPGVPLLQPEKLRDPSFLEALETLQPDLAIVVAFRMLPETVWAMPPLGTFNLHASLLPQYRGAAPINWAIMNGEPETGVTTFFLNSEIDKGAIIGQRRTAIGPDETFGELYGRLMDIGSELVAETVDRIAAGTALPVEQPEDVPCTDGGILRPAPKIFKEDCLVDWEGNCREIHDKIRGLSPYPAAWCRTGPGEGDTVKILTAHYALCGSGEELPETTGRFDVLPGRHFRVSCADGWIYIDRLQMAGKRAMDTAEFLRGYRPEIFKALV